jgi:GT2 family glycosyltransferase
VYNNLPLVIKCLNSLLPTVDASRTEFLVQDDASTEYDIREIMGFPPFKVARNNINLGFIKNVNEAVGRAKGDIVCMFNQDVRCLHVGWADMMLSLMTANKAIGIVGPKLVFPESMGGGIQSCGGLFDAGRGPFHRYLGWNNIFDRRVNTTGRVSWITGACLMISREDFWKVGGLNDVDYEGGYFDDVDLCLRVIHELHKEVWYCAEATLEHSVGSAGGSKFFMHNSRAFHRLWDAKIIPDVDRVEVNY